MTFRKAGPRLLALAASFAVFFVASQQTGHANASAWYISALGPFIQDWSLTTAIAVDDDWSNVVAVMGYRGDDLTTLIGADPQTILADGAATPVDVIANQSNPNTNVNGGVAEFDGIANPTIALQGSGTADAPHITIQINKKSCPSTKFITITYKVRDIDGSADNAVQPVALQYRAGAVGNYINLPDAFVADATEGGTATKVSTVVQTLPFIPDTEQTVFFRIITANAAGNDEWVGLDDININCTAPTAALVSVSGRILKGKAEPAANARVTFTDEFGGAWTVRSNQFGYYQFDGLPAGRMFVVQVNGKGFSELLTTAYIDSATEGLDFNVQ